MIGILMSSWELKRILRKSKGYLGAYHPLAHKYKVDLCYFSTSRISTDTSTVKGYLYSYKDRSFSKRNMKIPKINLYYNTAYLRGKKAIEKIKWLRENKNIEFINLPFNSQRNKFKNYEYLKTFDLIKNHLPETEALSIENLTELINKHNKIIIKPKLGAKGRRITIIENKNDVYKISRTFPRIKYNKSNSKNKREVISQKQLEEFFNDNFKRPKRYLVQQWISILKYKGKPFDIRVAVQKTKKQNWKVTSCVARVAARKGIVTNLHQGGETVSIRKLGLSSIRKNLYRLSLDIAKVFEKKFPSTADIGLDLAVDHNHKIWYIEANFCSEKEKWSTQYQIPFAYVYSQYIKPRKDLSYG